MGFIPSAPPTSAHKVCVKSDANGNGATIEVAEGSQELNWVGQHIDTKTNPWGWTKSGDGTLIIKGTPPADEGRQSTYTINVDGGTLHFDASANKGVSGTVAVLVNEGTLSVKGDKEFDVTLNGTTLKLDASAFSGNVAVKGNSTIETTGKDGSALLADISNGENDYANLTLNANDTMYVYSDITHNGDLNITGDKKVELGGVWKGAASVANNGNVVIDADVELLSETTITNEGNIYINSGNLTVTNGSVSNGGAIVVGNPTATEESTASSATLKVGANGEVTSAIAVTSGSTLDLSALATFDASDLILDSGSVVVLGEGTTINVTGSLTLASGVIFDVACSYEEFTPETLFSFSNGAAFDPELDGLVVTIRTNDGLTNETATLRLAEDGSVTLVPEPTTATLSLLALAGLAARRRRK